jgi:hypothetical protein
MENEQQNLDDKLNGDSPGLQSGGSPEGGEPEAVKDAAGAEDLAMPKMGLSQTQPTGPENDIGESQVLHENIPGSDSELAQEAKASPDDWNENDADGEMPKMMENGSSTAQGIHGQDQVSGCQYQSNWAEP